jgi:hypothetical protein
LPKKRPKTAQSRKPEARSMILASCDTGQANGSVRLRPSTGGRPAVRARLCSNLVGPCARSCARSSSSDISLAPSDWASAQPCRRGGLSLACPTTGRSRASTNHATQAAGLPRSGRSRRGPGVSQFRHDKQQLGLQTREFGQEMGHHKRAALPHKHEATMSTVHTNFDAGLGAAHPAATRAVHPVENWVSTRYWQGLR